MTEHDPPLSALLSRVIAAVTATYGHAGAGTAPNPSLPMWAALLRVVTAESEPEANIVEASRLSKRAVRAAPPARGRPDGSRCGRAASRAAARSSR